MSWINDFVKLVFSLNLNELAIEAGFDLKKQHLPTKLYKYRSFDKEGRSLENLNEDKVWLADPMTFNDPYDCHHYIDFKCVFTALRDILPDELKNAITLEMRETFLERSASTISELQKAGDQMKHGMRLCSFSERADSTLMWAHYSFNHQGFCIEYDVTQPGIHPLTSRFMFPVVYSDDVFDATELINRAEGDQFNNLFLNLAALYKASDWSYEKEWRLLFANGMFEHPRTWDMPKPTAVFCGSHITEINENSVKEICHRRDIPLFKMEHDRHMYRMNPVKL